jgi:hypothetical protein
MATSSVRKKVIALITGFALACILVVIVDRCIPFFVSINERPVLHWSSSGASVFFVPDSLLGYHPPRKAITVRAMEETPSGREIYNVTYTFDSLGRRVTPRPEDLQPSYFAMFTIGSFAFGEGLNDNQTIPYFFSKAAPEFESYNYSFSGYGPQQMCELLGQKNFGSEMQEHRGVLIYTFIDAHIDRAIGSMYVYNGWCRKCPYFVRLENGDVLRKGNFTSGRPLTSLLYRILGMSNIVKYLGWNLPSHISQNDLEVTVGLIAESQKRFLASFPDSKFYVAFFPGCQYSKQLCPMLRQAGITYFDYSGLIYLRNPEYFIDQMDKHPSSVADSTIANMLVRDLRISNPSFFAGIKRAKINEVTHRTPERTRESALSTSNKFQNY